MALSPGCGRALARNLCTGARDRGRCGFPAAESVARTVRFRDGGTPDGYVRAALGTAVPGRYGIATARFRTRR